MIPTAQSPVRLICAGSRAVSNMDFVHQQLDALHAQHPIAELVSGGAAGPDHFGELWAKRNGVRLTIMRARWDKYGTKAGPIRNTQMAEYILDQSKRDGIKPMLIAFWDGESNGTRHMISVATSYKIDSRTMLVSL